MYIIARDHLGEYILRLDESGVSFANGIAYVTTDEGEDFKIPIDSIDYIGTEQE